jgi:DNA-binding NarL/FixJ family response regulator
MTLNGTIHALLVEDKPQDARLIRTLVNDVPSVHFTWENIASLAEAKEFLRLEPFDLVLLDLSLPDSQGLDTFTDIYPHAICLPVVVLASTEDERFALQAMRSGAQDYFIKEELEGEFLVQALQRAIERKRVETALRIRNQQLTLLVEQLKPKTRFSPSLDNLAAILIHELNNPLAKVSAQLEELTEQFGPDDPRGAALLSIHAEVERMGRLVGNLLQASMQNAGQESVAITERLQDILAVRASNPQSEETNFFEALGAWVLDYISSSTTATSRSLNRYLQQIKKGSSARHEPLSQREHQVVYLVAKGYTNKEIGRQLSLSVRTVERYSASVMKKLDLHNRAELITFAVREGIINGNDVQGSDQEREN